MELFPEDDILDCYPEEIFEGIKVTKNFLCPIKYGVFRDPVVDRCGHTYCNRCIQSWLDANDKETCPLTGLAIDKDLFAPNLTLRNMIDELGVRCLHYKKGCEWKGTTSELVYHIRHECPEVRIKCLFNLCRKFIHRKKFDQHSETCDFRPTECELCSQVFPHSEMEFHLTRCEYYQVSCDQDCGSMIQRLKIDSHKKIDCPNTVVSCHFAMFGCDKKVKKKEMKEHVEGSFFEHLVSLKDKFEKISIENNTLKSENQNLSSQVKILTNELQDIKEELKYQEEAFDEKLQDNVVRWQRIPKVCSKCNEAKNLGMTKKLFAKSSGEYVCFDCLNQSLI